MALLNSNNNYIRLLEDGTAFFYDSPIDRELELEDFVGMVNRKYEEILAERYDAMIAVYENLGLTNYDYENRYEEIIAQFPDLKAVSESYFEVLDEQTDFNNLVAVKDAESIEGREFTFPIISPYYGDVKSRIPRYFVMTSSTIATDSVDNTYEKAKMLGVFGDTKDC